MVFPFSNDECEYDVKSRANQDAEEKLEKLLNANEMGNFKLLCSCWMGILWFYEQQQLSWNSFSIMERALHVKTTKNRGKN